MQELSLDDIKDVELDLLKSFASFCDQYNFTYYICGGTLIGALRHKGFIPWDDDIDIMMPRDDYEKALSLYSHDYYEIDSLVNNKQSAMRYGRLYDRRTVLRSSWKEEINESVFIDIFPIDGLPNTKLEQKLLFFLQQFFIAIHLSTVLRYTISTRYADRNSGILGWKKYVRTAVKFFLMATIGNTKANLWARILDKNAKKYSFKTQEEVAVLVSGPHGSKECMPKYLYENKVEVDFEGYKFYTLSGYDTYLTKMYGNYMQMPPKEKQASHHDFSAYWKDDN